MKIQVLIVDDHGVMRAGLRMLLQGEPDMEVLGEAGDGATALEQIIALQPDVVLLDIGLPDMTGLQVLRALQGGPYEGCVLILTVHEDPGLLREAIHAGAGGYMIKRAVGSELIMAVRVVARGDLYIHPSLMRLLIRDLSDGPTSRGRLESLTPRETEVLHLLVRGYTSRQAAEELCISPRTVEAHRAKLMSKLRVHNRVELMSFAEEHGLLD